MAKKNMSEILRNNAVTIMFILLCLGGLAVSGQTVPYVVYELFGRLSRNAFLVLALIIPIVAGMGINFAVTIGAMAAQISALWVVEWGISGVAGFATAAAMTVIIGIVFTFLGIFLAPYMLRLMKTPANVLPQSTAYLKIYFKYVRKCGCWMQMLVAPNYKIKGGMIATVKNRNAGKRSSSRKLGLHPY